MLLTLDQLIPREHYTAKDISPRFWPNGKVPVREDWKQLAAEGFKGYKLKGMVMFSSSPRTRRSSKDSSTGALIEIF